MISRGSPQLPLSSLPAIQRHATGVLAVVLITALASPALARPDSRSMSCAAATALGGKSGSVIMTTGPGVYGEVYASPSGCRARVAQAMRAPTKDNPKCAIGYTCRPYSGGNH